MDRTAYRKKRVKRLKKELILLLCMALCLSISLSVTALVKLHRMEKTLAELTETLAEISTQKDLLTDVSAQVSAVGTTASSGQGTNETANSSREVSGELIAQEAELDSSKQAELEAAHKVYLTFDDGPSIYTEDILDILDRYDIKATFFVVGKETEDAKQAYRDIVEKGHTLGMHSYSHKYSEIYASEETFAEDFRKLQDYLEEVTGVKSNVYRFPGGSSNTVSKVDMKMLATFLNEQNVRFFDWNVASGDGSSARLSVDTLVKNSTKGLEEYAESVILLHDSGEKRTTVEALPIIIEKIQAMEDTVILPITDATEPVQHIQISDE